MRITSVKFHNSYVNFDDVENESTPEIAFVGRSNVGKSSFINYLVNAKIAKTSSSPGKTRLINYFNVNSGRFFLVDLPGYGFARASQTDQDKWKNMIEKYFEKSKNLKHVLLLLDIRIEPTVKDLQMASYLNFYKIPYTPILTKCDKLSKSQMNIQRRKIASKLKVGVDNVFCVSSSARFGGEDILLRFDQFV